MTIDPRGNGEFGEVTCDSAAEALSVKLFVEEIPSDPGPTWQYGFTMDGHSLKQEEDLTQALLSALIHRTNTIKTRSVQKRHSLTVERQRLHTFLDSLMTDYQKGLIPSKDNVYYYKRWEEMWESIDGNVEPDLPSVPGPSLNAGAAQPSVLALHQDDQKVDEDTGMDLDPDSEIENEDAGDAMDTS